MTPYRLSDEAKNDLIRIPHYGLKTFGIIQADKYFESCFKYFEVIAKSPFSFDSADPVKKDYRHCFCGVYSIYFKVNEDIVEIITIVGRQDLNEKL